MRPLSELCTGEPAWPALRDAIERSGRAEALAIDPGTGDRTLVALQVTDRSPLGAIARNTGGLRVDDGWIHVLGAAPDGLLAFNPSLGLAGDGPPVEPALAGALVVGADLVGGFFVVDGGAFGAPGRVLHLEPDTLELRPMAAGYGEWLGWVLGGDLDRYYAGLRWPGWRDEARGIPSGRGLHLYPPPFTVEGRDPARASRRAVPLRELWGLAWSFRAQLGIG